MNIERLLREIADSLAKIAHQLTPPAERPQASLPTPRRRPIRPVA
jgi:hypothetical protein